MEQVRRCHNQPEKNALKAKESFKKILSLKYVMLKTMFVFKNLYLVLFAEHHCKRVFYLTCLCSSQSCDNMCVLEYCLT